MRNLRMTIMAIILASFATTLVACAKSTVSTEDRTIAEAPTPDNQTQNDPSDPSKRYVEPSLDITKRESSTPNRPVPEPSHDTPEQRTTLDKRSMLPDSPMSRNPWRWSHRGGQMNNPETINFHGHKLVKNTVPDWFLASIAEHDNSTCNSRPESEITRELVKAFDTHKASFLIREIIGEEEVGFALCDASKGLIRVCDTEASVGKPVVHIDKMDDRSLEELVAEYGFDLVLSILSSINAEPPLEEVANSIGLSPEELAVIYDNHGWNAVAERGVTLPTQTADGGKWKIAFWTEGYNHYIEIDTDGYNRLLFVDGLFLSIVPDKYPISYTPENLEALWGKGNVNETTYSYFEDEFFNKVYSHREVCANEEGLFFTLQEDCMVYTIQWQFGRLPEWAPTNKYPIMGTSSPIRIKAYGENGWMTVEGKSCRVLETCENMHDKRFGVKERFELTFENVNIVQPFIRKNGNTIKDAVAMVATPEKNRIWRITMSEVQCYYFDQVEVTSDGVYVRKDNEIQLIAVPNPNGGQLVDEGHDTLFYGVQFKTVLKREDIHHWKSPGTLESRDGLYIISTEDDITIKLG